MPTTETQRPQLAQVEPKRRLAFLDGLADLERQAPTRLFVPARELRPVIQLPHREVGNESGWSLVNDSSLEPKPSRRLKVDPHAIGAAVDWFAEQDFPPDAGESIRREAWR